MSKVLIVGGGVAGLSAGIYARLHGFDAVVCEAHAVAGGCLTSWERGGCHIDNCIHWLTGTNPEAADGLYAVWKDLGMLGEGVELRRRPYLYQVEADGKTVEFHRDLREMERQMLEASPEDEKETRGFIRAVDAVMRLLGIAEDGRRLSGSLLTGTPVLARYWNLSVGELAERFSHPALRRFISSFFPTPFGAFVPVFVAANFCGGNADLPMGGSHAAAKRLTDRFVSLGGELLLKKEAVRIRLDGARAAAVAFSDGTELTADWIVSALDPACLFRDLLDVPVPKALKRQYDDPRLERFSSFHTAFRCSLPELSFDGDFTVEIPVKYRSILPGTDLLVRHDTHEKDYAPEGSSLLQVLTYCTEDACRKFIRARENDRDFYRDWKKQIAKLEEELLCGQFPELRGRLTCVDVWTPATYKRYVRSDVGSFQSFVMPKKLRPRFLSCGIPGVENVVLAGQWLQPPGGLPIAALSGKYAVEEIGKRAAR